MLEGAGTSKVGHQHQASQPGAEWQQLGHLGLLCPYRSQDPVKLMAGPCTSLSICLMFNSSQLRSLTCRICCLFSHVLWLLTYICKHLLLGDAFSGSFRNCPTAPPKRFPVRGTQAALDLVKGLASNKTLQKCLDVCRSRCWEIQDSNHPCDWNSYRYIYPMNLTL